MKTNVSEYNNTSIVITLSKLKKYIFSKICKPSDTLKLYCTLDNHAFNRL